MDVEQPDVPIVISFSTNDPTGVTGIQADIEVLGSLGCRCTPVITGIVANHKKQQHWPCPSNVVFEQAHRLLDELPIKAIKIGGLGTIENIHIVSNLIQHHGNIPIIFDPALSHESIHGALDWQYIKAIEALILPFATIGVMNAKEAKLFAQQADTIDACAQEIMGREIEYLLITNTPSKQGSVSNNLYGNFRKLNTFTWQKHPEEILGAGCTLSAAVAGLIGQKLPVNSAIFHAQQYTNTCIKFGLQDGRNEKLLNRLFWARKDFDYNALQKTH